MTSIEEIKLQLKSQFRDLNKIWNNKISDDCIFVGSGDSYIAGLITEFLTDHKCRCYSPSDLLNLRFTENKTYCFISVTGNTKVNINVAQRATDAGVRTIAVTLNKNSKLAEICKEIIPLKISTTNTPADGFRTFFANVITCLQLAGVTIPQKFETWYKNGMQLALHLSKSIQLPMEVPIYFLGNDLRYCFALYASLKATEFFGSTAIPHKLEEFCHSPIFGTRKSHHVWIFGQNELPIGRSIEKLGLHVSYCELYNSDKIAQLFQSVFFLQSLMVLLAERHGITQMQYLLETEKLKTSSELIYNV